MKRIFVLLMCLVLALACFTGCTKNDSFTKKSYAVDGEQITEICIDVQDRKIEVEMSDDNKIHIVYFENSKEYYDVSVSENAILTMTAASNKDLTDYIGVKPSVENRIISLQIPNKFLSTLRLSTTNETISLSELNVVGHIFLSSQGSNIVFDKLNVRNSITLNVKNGDINGSIIGSYDDYAIICDIKKGESNLPSSKGSGEKALTVSNNNGDIDIEFIRE